MSKLYNRIKRYSIIKAIKPIHLAQLSLLILFIPNELAAQNIQKNKNDNPSKIVVDGDIAEWGTLQASAGSNRLKYKLSNDDNNLYLVVQSTGVWSNAKVIHGGVTFIISPSLDKKNRQSVPGNVIVTFPVIDKSTGSKLNQKQYGFFNIVKKEDAKSQKSKDSLIKAANQLISVSFKEIGVKGIPDIDTLISVYNTTGLKAAASFDANMLYCYELVIPLRYLNLPADSKGAFSYDIRLNGPTLPGRTYTRKIYNNEDPNDIPTTEVPSNVEAGKTINPENYYRFYPSDFWSEYTILKTTGTQK